MGRKTRDRTAQGPPLHAEAELSQLKPISAAGCAALVAYATEDLAAGEGPEWPMAALANVVEALKNIAARGVS